jgi:hypothetical protein
MATKLHLRKSQEQVPGFLDAYLTGPINDDGEVTGIVTVSSSEGGADRLFDSHLGSSVKCKWVSPAIPAGGHVLSGDFTGQIMCMEGHVSHNLSLKVELRKRTPAGVETTLGSSTSGEMNGPGTGRSVRSQTFAVSSALAEGDRLMLVVYASGDPLAGSGTHWTQVWYERTDGFMNFTQDLPFAGASTLVGSRAYIL